VLRELALPKQGLVWALLNFNVGVEAGQAIAVIVAVPLLIWLRRFRWEPRAVAAISVAVLVVGLTLFVDRAFLTGKVRVLFSASPFITACERDPTCVVNLDTQIRISIVGPLNVEVPSCSADRQYLSSPLLRCLAG